MIVLIEKKNQFDNAKHVLPFMISTKTDVVFCSAIPTRKLRFKLEKQIVNISQKYLKEIKICGKNIIRKKK